MTSLIKWVRKEERKRKGYGEKIQSKKRERLRRKSEIKEEISINYENFLIKNNCKTIGRGSKIG